MDNNVQKVQVTQYRCLICGTLYTHEFYANECAAKPVTHDYIKVGDVVRIIKGDGAGHTATVETVSIIGNDWDDLDYRRKYWHTTHLQVEVNHPDFHKRFLVFDHYRTIKTAAD